MAKLFKKREAFEIADRTNKLNSDKKASFKLSPFKFVDASGTNIDDKEVMQKWVERKLTVQAENQIITREYMKKDFWKDFGWIALGALLIVFGFDYFVGSSAGLFPFGSQALSSFFAVLVARTDKFRENYALWVNTFNFVFLFAINIPLMIFGYLKVGTKFTLLTILFLALNIGMNEAIAYIPYINPNDWSMMVDSKTIGLIPTSFNSGVWMFIKAIFGGAIMGLGYALVYKGHGSSAGTDFVTMYFSIRYEKSIATVNRTVYYFILALVIVLNAVTLPVYQSDAGVKFGQIYMNKDVDSWNNMIAFAFNDNNKGQFTPEFAKIIELNKDKWNVSLDAESYKTMLKDLNDPAILKFHKDKLDITIGDYKELVTEVSKSDYGFAKGEFTNKQIGMMKWLYIFGPSLFASLVLMVVSTLVTDYFYPTHKVKTYVIATDHADEMKVALDQIGYRNNFIRFNAENEFQGKVLDRDVIMITMTVTNWREVEPALLEVDERMSVNILKTDRVKGYFDYHIRSDRQNEEAFQILKKDKAWMKEIHEDSLVKTDKEYAKYMTQRQKIIDRNTIEANEDAQTVKELNEWYRAQIIKIKKTKQRELLSLEHDWLLEFAESQKQYDYIRKEYNHKLKALGTPDKKRLHSVKKEYETKKKQILAK